MIRASLRQMVKSGFILVAALLLLAAGLSASAAGGITPSIISGPNGQPAVTVDSYTVTCSTVFVTGKSSAPHVFVSIPTTGTAGNFGVYRGTYSATLNFPRQHDGQPIVVHVWGTNSKASILFAPYWDGQKWTNIPIPFESGNVPTSSYWDGHDWTEIPGAPCVANPLPAGGAVNPLPADRLSVWCNANLPTANPPANIAVYGIGNGQFWLATFYMEELFQAGSRGVTKDAGPGNGTISAMTDGRNDFYVAWNGGKYGANGQAGFSKSFRCNSWVFKDYNTSRTKP